MQPNSLIHFFSSSIIGDFYLLIWEKHRAFAKSIAWIKMRMHVCVGTVRLDEELELISPNTEASINTTTTQFSHFINFFI